jgi:hypothetical protein
METHTFGLQAFRSYSMTKGSYGASLKTLVLSHFPGGSEPVSYQGSASSIDDVSPHY